jgi:hypothetical protein
LKAIATALAENAVCALLGPRQCGKTTLARQIADKGKSYFFDLETATGRTRLEHSPELTLSELQGLVVIDFSKHASEWSSLDERTRHIRALPKHDISQQAMVSRKILTRFQKNLVRNPCIIY